MPDYLDSGHMSIASHLFKSNKVFYLPHHCVTKPDSLTTKLRVVFDASQKYSQGISLNDSLYVVPKSRNDSVSLLIHFRIDFITFTAYIQQMFIQISISPKHSNHQRIFWRFSKDDPIEEYYLNTVTFRVASSPYLANTVIK